MSARKLLILLGAVCLPWCTATETLAEGSGFTTACRTINEVDHCNSPMDYLNFPTRGAATCHDSITTPVNPSRSCRFVFRANPYDQVSDEGTHAERVIRTSKGLGGCVVPPSISLGSSCAARTFAASCPAGGTIDVSSDMPVALEMNYCCYDPGHVEDCAGLQAGPCPRPSFGHTDADAIWYFLDSDDEVRFDAWSLLDYDPISGSYNSEPGDRLKVILWPTEANPLNTKPTWSPDGPDESFTCIFKIHGQNNGYVRASEPPHFQVFATPGVWIQNIGVPEHGFVHTTNIKAGECGDEWVSVPSAKLNMKGSCLPQIMKFQARFTPGSSSLPPRSCASSGDIFHYQIENTNWKPAVGFKFIESSANDQLKDGGSAYFSVCCQSGNNAKHCHHDSSIVYQPTTGD